MEILNQTLDFMRSGFDQVNALQGLVIAAVAALILPEWRRLPMFAVGATLAHIGVDIVRPLFSGSGQIRLPDILEFYFWEDIAFLLIGYLIIIAVLYLVRRVLLRR